MVQTYEIQGLSNFRFWCQKVLPAVYDDSLSYYELLCKVIDKLNEVIAKSNEQSEVINLLASELMRLKLEFDKFKNSGFWDYYERLLERWLDENIYKLLEKIIQNGVYFGLTEDGYFIAYTFRSWAHVQFDTVADYGNDDYGCLVLYY